MIAGGHAQPGDLIAGRFRLERPLGAGGMGEVWVAQQLALDRKVALKLIRPDTLGARKNADELIERFQQEAKALARLQHPHVVQVIDAGSDEHGRLFLVMELLEGETLRARMNEGLGIEESARVAAEIASALVASHAAGILHRDLKAENVFLARSAGASERAKVLDFGLSRLSEQEDKSLTPTGAIVGTPGYIAPEQVLGEPVDARADLYALGVILFEMIAGAAPFQGQNAIELIMQHASVPAPRVSVIAARKGRDVPRALDDLVDALLSKRAADRPRDAEAVRALLLGAPVPAGSSAPRVAGTSSGTVTSAATDTISASSAPAARPLLGRERELATLEAALDDAAAGRGALVLLAGEPGIGKTRLCDAFAAAAARRGSPVVWGRAWEAGSAPAFHPWSEALETLIDSMPEPPSADEAATLGEIVRALRVPGQNPVVLDPNEARFRLFAAVGALLKRASAARPIAILLDDLHAADAASLQLLLSVARDLPRRRVVIVGTYRDVEAELNDDVKELVGRLAREARTLHLTRLQSADVDALVMVHAGHHVGAAVGQAIFKATQGNPLFVDEMVRLLSSQGRLESLGDAPLPVPLGVREAIRQRLSRATGPTRAALEVFAVLGRESRLADAIAVHGAPLEDALREGVRFGVLARAERGVVRFAHALYREELLGELDEARTSALHLRAADVLRAQPEPPLVDIAGHLLDAGPAHAARATDAALEAADSLIARLAFEDAAALVQRALDSAPALDDARRADCFILLGRAVMLAGDVPRAHALCLRAADIARAQKDHELLARAALGYGARVVEATVDERLVGLLREASVGLDEKPLWRARVLARLASAMQPAPDAWGAVAIATEAFALAAGLSDQRTRLAVLHDGMGALMSVEAPARRRVVNLEALQLAERFGDATRALRARFRLALDATEEGDGSAQPAIDAYAADADRYHSRDAQWRAALLTSMWCAARGDEPGSDAAIARAEAAGAPQVPLLAHRYLRANLRQRPAERAPYEATWAETYARFDPNARGVLDAVAAMEREDSEAARAALARLDSARHNFFLDRTTLRATAFAGDTARAARLLPTIDQCEHVLFVETAGFGLIEPVDVILSALLGTLGRHDEACAVAQRGIETIRRLAVDAMLPLALVDAALVHARAGAKEKARALLDEGRARMEQMRQPGLAPNVRRAEAALSDAR